MLIVATEHLTASDESSNTSHINATKGKAFNQHVDRPPLTAQSRYSKNITWNCINIKGRECNKRPLKEWSNKIVFQDKHLNYPHVNQIHYENDIYNTMCALLKVMFTH